MQPPAATWNKEAAYGFDSDLAEAALLRKLRVVKGWQGKKGLAGRWLWHPLPHFPASLGHLSFEAVHRRDARIRTHVTLRLHPRRVFLRLDASIPDVEAAWQALVAEVLQELLPSLGARNVRPAPVRERHGAWSFRSDLPFATVVRQLDALETWVGRSELSGRWLCRDSDRLGDYLSRGDHHAGDSRYPTSTSIYWDEKQVTTWLGALVPEIEPAWQAHVTGLLQDLLPSLGARDVMPSDFER
jgi:hypothetical protein